MKELFLRLRRLWDRLFRWPKCYTFARVEDLPDHMEADIVYIAGENGHLWYAAFLCPCGCNATIQLGLMKGHRPRWNVTEHVDGTVSLHPSVWRKVGCRSHFLLKKGKVMWAG